MEEDDMEVMTEQSCVTGKILIKHNVLPPIFRLG